MCNKIITNLNCDTIILDEEFDSEFVYVYVLQYNSEIPKSLVVIRKEESESIVFNIGKDGFYTLCRAVIPRDNSQPCYYYKSKFYYNDKEAELLTLLDLNPEVSKLNILYSNYFQICHLRLCYINTVQSILNEIDSCGKSLQKDLTYKRDLLWMAINAILYYAEIQQYDEATSLLKRISGCNGLCNCYKEDCGCGK